MKDSGNTVQETAASSPFLQSSLDFVDAAFGACLGAPSDNDDAVQGQTRPLINDGYLPEHTVRLLRPTVYWRSRLPIPIDQPSLHPPFRFLPAAAAHPFPLAATSLRS